MIYNTQSAQISRRQDGHDMYVIMKTKNPLGVNRGKPRVKLNLVFGWAPKISNAKNHT